MAKEIELEIFTGKREKNPLEDYLTNHISSFDYYNPVRNFLYNLGIRDVNRYLELIDEGYKIIPNERQKEYAREFLNRWLTLIENVKQGKEVPPYNSCFGPIKIFNDKHRIEGDNFEYFKKYVNGVCVIAEYNLEDILNEMLK